MISEVLKEYDRPFVQVEAEASLFDALKILLENKVKSKRGKVSCDESLN